MLKTNSNNINIDDLRIKLINSAKKDRSSFQNLINYITSIEIDHAIGILSLSTEWNNLLLWSHYGDQHKGFCIGLNFERLKKYFNHGDYNHVNYPENDNYPKIHPLANSYEESYYPRVFTKSKVWKYESEFRFVKRFKESSVNNSDSRKLKISPDIISEVFLGCKSTEKTQDEIKALCERYQIPVIKTKMHEFNFSLDKDI